MESILNRLKAVVILRSKHQRLGACMMFLSSIAFFNSITWSPHILFQRQYCIAATVVGFLIGALLAHGMQKTTHLFLELAGVNLYIIGWAFIINGLLVANTHEDIHINGVLGVYIVFLGLVFYFLLKENPTRVIIGNHILEGSTPRNKSRAVICIRTLQSSHKFIFLSRPDMDSLLNRLKAVFILSRNYQLLGAWIMLLSSIAFFNIITGSDYILFPRHYCTVATIVGYLIGALLTHRMQKTNLFLDMVGVNLYIIGWAFIVKGLLVANTYLELYMNGVLGIYIAFLGVLFYSLFKENLIQVIENHISVGLIFSLVAAMIFLLARFEVDINLFYLVRVRQPPTFWGDKAIVSVLVGIKLLFIGLFMYVFPSKSL